MHRVVLPKCSIKHTPFSKVAIQPHFSSGKINNLHQLAKPIQQTINVKSLHSINPLSTVSNTKPQQWRLMAISEIKTPLRCFRPPPWAEDEKKQKDKKTYGSFFDRFGSKTDPSLPTEIPILIYGFVGSILVPMFFVLVTSALVLWLVNNDDFTTWAQRVWKNFKKQVGQMYFQPFDLPKKWSDWQEHTKVFSMFLLANTAVFGLWQWANQKVQEALFYNFMHSTVHKNPIGMLLSGISHKSIGHFMFNMLALYSFCGTSMLELGNAQMLGIFTVGCLAASSTSHIFKLVTRDIAPSLGASGGVFALVAASTYLNPEMQLSFIFLPTYPFYAKVLLPVLMGFDLFGAILRATGRRWLGLDHAAHLGGAAFGLLYTHWIVSHLSETTRVEVARRKKNREISAKRQTYGLPPLKDD